MDIFHHFGDNGRIDDFDDSSLDSRRANQPLFSVANMYEPGIFILEEMANLRTKGIAAFMYKPNSIYGYKIFENIFFHIVIIQCFVFLY